VAIFTIPIAIGIDAENQCLISLRQLADCGALNRHFCQTAVMGCSGTQFFCPRLHVKF